MAGKMTKRIEDIKNKARDIIAKKLEKHKEHIRVNNANKSFITFYKQEEEQTILKIGTFDNQDLELTFDYNFYTLQQEVKQETLEQEAKTITVYDEKIIFQSDGKELWEENVNLWTDLRIERLCASYLVIEKDRVVTDINIELVSLEIKEHLTIKLGIDCSKKLNINITISDCIANGVSIYLIPLYYRQEFAGNEILIDIEKSTFSELDIEFYFDRISYPELEWNVVTKLDNVCALSVNIKDMCDNTHQVQAIIRNSEVAIWDVWFLDDLDIRGNINLLELVENTLLVLTGVNKIRLELLPIDNLRFVSLLPQEIESHYFILQNDRVNFFEFLEFEFLEAKNINELTITKLSFLRKLRKLASSSDCFREAEILKDEELRLQIAQMTSKKWRKYVSSEYLIIKWSDYFSDFGKSLWRPIFWILVVGIIGYNVKVWDEYSFKMWDEYDCQKLTSSDICNNISFHTTGLLKFIFNYSIFLEKPTSETANIGFWRTLIIIASKLFILFCSYNFIRATRRYNS
jgi:hypothetical protein